MRIAPDNFFLKSERGFTLVEIMVVIALIAFIGVFAIPTVSNYFKISLNSTVRNVATTVKEAYNSTVITGRVHRIVWDLDNQQFWVESGPSEILLDSAESQEIDQIRKRNEGGSDDDEDAPPPQFAIEESVTSKKIDLPRGVTFGEIFTEQSPDPIIEGVTFTHFFPHGITEQTVVQLQDTDEHNSSLIISPLIGKTRVIDDKVTREEVFGDKK